MQRFKKEDKRTNVCITKYRFLYTYVAHERETLRKVLLEIRTKVRITKSEISMRTWRSPMSAASQGAFVVIPEISHSDISYITKK